MLKTVLLFTVAGFLVTTSLFATISKPQISSEKQEEYANKNVSLKDNGIVNKSEIATHQKTNVKETKNQAKITTYDKSEFEIKPTVKTKEDQKVEEEKEEKEINRLQDKLNNT